MLTSLKKALSTLMVTAVFAVPVFAMAAPVSAQVEANTKLCQGVNLTEGNNSEVCDNEGAEDSVNNIIITVIDIFSLVVGAVSVIMIIIGGLRYITSAGESSNVQAAKNTILYAIVGLVIVIFAQTIVKFVVSRITEA